jgi:hypothetical protein
MSGLQEDPRVDELLASRLERLACDEAQKVHGRCRCASVPDAATVLVKECSTKLGDKHLAGVSSVLARTAAAVIRGGHSVRALEALLWAFNT